MWLFLLLPSSVDTVRLRGIGTEPIGTILIRASRSRTVQCTTIAIYLHRAVRTPSVVGLKGSWTKIPCHLGAHRSGLRLSIWRSLLIKPHTPHAHRTYTALMMYDTPHSGAPAPPSYPLSVPDVYDYIIRAGPGREGWVLFRGYTHKQQEQTNRQTEERGLQPVEA